MVERIAVSDAFPDPAFPLKVETAVLDSGFRLHSHEFTELVVITEGEGTHIAEGARYPVEPGDVWVLQGLQSHGFEDCRGLTLYNGMFVPERLPLPMPQLRGIPGYHALFILEPLYRHQHRFRSRLKLTPDALSGLLPLLRGAEAHLSSGMPGGQAMALSLFLQVMVVLSGSYEGDGMRPSRDLMRLARVLTAIESDYARTWTLGEMADMANMSENQFIRVFKAVTGRSPMDHLIRYRINRSAALMLSGGLSVTEAALQSGFGDPSYFARQFRKHMGTTPSAYRGGAGRQP